MRKRTAWVLAIALLALGVRVLYLGFGPGLSAPLGEDERQYDEIAQNIATTGSFYQEFDGKRFRSFRAPLYPFAVAGVYRLTGGSREAVILLQCLLDSFVAVMVYQLASIWFASSRVPVLAALLYALHPFAIYRSATLMTETLSAAILIVTMYAFARIEQHRRQGVSERSPTRFLLLAGAGLGLAGLVKAGLAPLGPLVVIWAWITFRPGWRAVRVTAVIGLAMVAVMLPWTIRNFVVHEGRFIPVATEGGTTLLGGNNAEVLKEGEYLGFWYNPSRLHLVSEELSETEESQAQTGEAVKFISSHLEEMPRLLFYKALNTWVIHPYYALRGPWLRRGVYLSHAAMTPFWILGVVVVIRRSRPRAANRWVNPIMIWLLLGNLFFLCLVFYGSGRFRAPAEPYLVMLAAVGLVWILEKTDRWPVAGALSVEEAK